MKKYILVIAAMVLFAGISSAQAEKKQPVNSTKQVSAVSRPATVKKSGSETTTLTPGDQSTKKQTASTEAIKRKHHPKKKASLKKTENK